ncbi:MAG: patatin-like protein [Desulforhopalus sp.]|nr:patatin-like protein [Desulforhopalus sp.]
MNCQNHQFDSQEIRYAVVMYGGISLAIYMNGIAQEMLRLVRATSVADESALQGTEKIYRELSCLLHLGRRPGETTSCTTPRTRFVIDVLAGTSAGGINAIFLAKALALKSKNLNDLRDLWMEKADLDTLLNDKKGEDGGRFQTAMPKKSLLNSRRMYGLLRDAFAQMEEKDKIDTTAGESADRIDLYVTATDLNGLIIPLELTDTAVLERKHHSVFHFEYDPLEETNDFDSKYDAMLAFAARCTSSFPGAFEPMRFGDIFPQPTAEDCKEFQRFFENYHEPAETSASGDKTQARPERTSFKERVFADGGYLDNRPFGHVIDRIGERTSNCTAFRKLIFVDPFPEHLEQCQAKTEFNFIENSILAATTLPRYETIRQDIARINEMNRKALRASEIEKAMFRIDPTGTRQEPDHMKLKDGQLYGDLYLDELLNIKGGSFVNDQQMKIAHVSNWLALVVTRQLGLNETGDYYRVVRLIVKAWRNATFAGTKQEGITTNRKSQTNFIYRYDFGFRLSRLRYLIYMMDRVAAFNDIEFDAFRDQLLEGGTEPAVSKSEFPRNAFLAALAPVRERHTKLLTGLSRTNKLIEARNRRPAGEHGTNVLQERTDALRNHFSTKNLLELLNLVDTDVQQHWAEDLYLGAASLIDNYFTALADVIHANLKSVYEEKDTLVRQADLKDGSIQWLAAVWLLHLWKVYESTSAVMARLLPNGRVGESGTVDVFRIGPADTDLTIRSALTNEQKLAGAKLGAFGAFLSEGWRENDILWGRLDGAERLIVSLLPDPVDKDLRNEYIRRAREEILQEEFNPANGRIYRWVAGQIHNHCGPGLSKDEIATRLELIKNGPLTQILSKVTNNPANWQAFIKEYYDIPRGPDRQQLADWLTRTTRIAGEMLEGVETFKGIAGKLKIAGIILMELVQVSLPGSLKTLLVSRILALLVIVAIILILLGSVFTSDFTSVGFKLLFYAGGIWFIVRNLRSWFSYGTLPRKTLLAVKGLVILGAAVLSTLGYQVAIGYLQKFANLMMPWMR